MPNGWEYRVLKVMGARDFRITLVAREALTANYLRLSFDDGGLLAASALHPTMWIRLWFQRAGKPHQRGFTLVDPDAEAGTFDVDVALHPGTAAYWAQRAPLGSTLEATVQGSKFEVPAPTPRHVAVVGGPASAPAINSLLAAMPATPATVWFEEPTADEETPLRQRQGDEVIRVARTPGSTSLHEAVAAGLDAYEAEGQPPDMYWIAVDTSTTRALVKHLRQHRGVDKAKVHAMAYWYP